MKQTPLQLDILDLSKHIVKYGIDPVTSTGIKKTGSIEFDEEGLFSEKIFGEITADDRFTKFGYIDLRVTIIHPRVYKSLIKLKKFYEEILNGSSYAIFDKTEKDLIQADSETTGAGTGYSFFMRHFKDIVFKETKSRRRQDNIKLMNKYPTRDRLLCNKWLVIPAGIREYNEEAGAVGMEEINKLYMTLINYVRALPVDGRVSHIFDGLKMSIQRKVNEIHQYLFELMQDGKGFLEGKFAYRNLALGTRNVIIATPMKALSPDGDKSIKSNETRMPLFQAVKSFQPLVVNQLKTMFFDNVFDSSTNKAALIHKDTYVTEYVELSSRNRDKYSTSEGIEKFINNYANESIRKKPVSIYDDKGQEYYAFLIYDDGKEIYIIRDLQGFETFMKGFETITITNLKKIDDVVYSKPYTLDQMKEHITTKRYKEISSGQDEVHYWRATTGIELIHKEPTYQEFIRISKNWYAMTPEQKTQSDKRSRELFGITNDEHIRDLIVYYNDKHIFRESRLRPMTMMEILYIAAHEAVKGKHVFTTRYPVTGIESIYPSGVKIITTSRSRIVTLRSQYDNDSIGISLPKYTEYPNLQEPSIDGVQIHPMRLAGLDGD